jgi:CHASE2 domain-containing sensor protein
MNKSHLLRYGSIIFLTFCIVRIAWWLLPNTLGVWELQANDQFMLLAHKWKGNQETTPDIVHIDLDDQSVSSLPYSKNDPRLYAQLIRILSASGVKAVLVDMLFPKCRD